MTDPLEAHRGHSCEKHTLYTLNVKVCTQDWGSGQQICHLICHPIHLWYTEIQLLSSDIITEKQNDFCLDFQSSPFDCSDEDNVQQSALSQCPVKWRQCNVCTKTFISQVYERLHTADWSICKWWQTGIFVLNVYFYWDLSGRFTCRSVELWDSTVWSVKESKSEGIKKTQAKVILGTRTVVAVKAGQGKSLETNKINHDFVRVNLLESIEHVQSTEGLKGRISPLHGKDVKGWRRHRGLYCEIRSTHRSSINKSSQHYFVLLKLTALCYKLEANKPAFTARLNDVIVVVLGDSALAGWWTHVQDRSHESTRLDCSYSVCERVVASSVAHTYRGCN